MGDVSCLIHTKARDPNAKTTQSHKWPTDATNPFSQAFSNLRSRIKCQKRYHAWKTMASIPHKSSMTSQTPSWTNIPPGSVQKSSQKLEIQLQQTLPDIFLERTQIKVCSPHLLPIFSILHNVGRKQPQICPHARKYRHTLLLRLNSLLSRSNIFEDDIFRASSFGKA